MHDPEALLAHEPFLRALARSLVRDPGDADDAVQETWAAALRHPPREGPTVRAWLAAVLRNAVRQGRRAGGRRAARERSAARPEAVPSEGEIREREAVRREVVEAVLALDPLHRDVLVLLYFEGLPPREAAVRLGVPVETVKSRRKRALARIREDLDRRRGGREAWVAAILPLAGGVGVPARRMPRVPRAVLASSAAVLLLGMAAAVALGPRWRGGAVGVSPGAGSPGNEAGGRPEAKTAGGGARRGASEGLLAGLFRRAFEGARTRGKVVDAAGLPVEGANVVLADDPRFADMQEEALTGADGTFAFDERTKGRWILAWVPGKGVSEWVTRPAGSAPLSLPLGPGGAVAGRVVDRASGAVVPGAGVELDFGDSRYEAMGARRTVSDAEGRYSFTDLPLGTVVEPRLMPGFRAASPGRVEREGRPEEILPGRIEDGEARILVRRGERWDRDVEAIRRPGVEAGLRLRFPPGLPVPASIRLLEDWEGEGGSIRMEWNEPVAPGAPAVKLFLPRGTVLVSAGFPGHRGSTGPLAIEGDGAPLSRDLDLRPIPKASVQLVDGDGAPLRRAGITVKPALQPPWKGAGPGMGTRSVLFLGHARTDDTGRADLTDLLPAAEDDSLAGQELLLLVEGKGVLETGVDHPSLRMGGEALLRLLRESGPSGFQIPVPAPATRELRIRVVDGDGTPAAGVEFEDPDEIGALRRARLGPLRSGPEGLLAVRLDDVSDLGLQDRLAARPPWHGDIHLSAILGASERGEVAVLKVHRLVRFRVTVRDGAGSPIPGARAAFAGREFRADGSGVVAVEVPDVAGAVSVPLDHPGFLPGEAERRPGEESAEVVLEAGRRIPVEVPVPEGRADTQLCVVVYDAVDGRRRSSCSAGTGKGVLRLDVPVLATGARLVAWTEDGAFRGEIAAGGAEERIRIPLAPTVETTIPLRFEDAEGLPVAGAAFTATFGTGGPNLSRTGVSGTDGRANVGVPFEPGCRLWVRVKGGMAWGACRVLAAPPAAPLRLAVDSTRTIEVSLGGARAKEGTWFALADGREPLQVWPGASREDGGRTVVPVDVPASASALSIDREGRSTRVPIPVGEVPAVIRID